MILFSVLMLIFGIVTKDYNGNYYKKSRYNSPPLEHYEVTLFGIDFSYINFLLFFIIVLGIGIYLLLYKNDQSLKNLVKNPKLFIQGKIEKSEKRIINKPEFLDKIKTKYSEFENKSLPNKELDIKQNSVKTSRVLSIVGTVSLFALFFTFFMASKMGFSLWFFIILSYYHFITLTPKSKKEILIKSIGYPLIFLFILMLIESGDLYDWNRNVYGLSKHFIPFLICVLIMFFTQRKRFDNPPKFSIKNPLFWISFLCLIISIVRFGIDKYIENSLN